MKNKEIGLVLEEGENESVEFKKSTSELKDAVVSIAAILNKHGEGELYFGIKNNGEVVGQEIGKDIMRETNIGSPSRKAWTHTFPTRAG